MRRLVFLELDERDARGLLGRVEYGDVFLPFKYDGVVLTGRMCLQCLKHGLPDLKAEPTDSMLSSSLVSAPVFEQGEDIVKARFPA